MWKPDGTFHRGGLRASAARYRSLQSGLTPRRSENAMKKLRTAGSMVLTLLAILVMAGGCVNSVPRVLQSMEAERRPDDALIAFAVAVVIAVSLILAARRLSRESNES